MAAPTSTSHKAQMPTSTRERWIVYPIVLWLVAFGGYLLATPASPSPNPGAPPA